MNDSGLEDGIRAVTHVATFFEELKVAATELTKRVDAQQRGYFTPAEEDDALALLVSYWQARNALFELITSYRNDRELPDSQRPASFLTAFAAALILIDAGRFLRERFHDRDVIRKKLNEPAPHFGIEGGVYDRVQKSLLSTRNAWHLYHAVQYFNQHQQALRLEARRREGLDVVLAIVDRLMERLDVSATRFARTKLRTRGSQVLRKFADRLFGRSMYGLQKLGCSLMAEKYLKLGHRPRLPAEIADAILDILRPGDILVVRKEYAITNYFLPGYWPHAALYLGDSASVRAMLDLAAESDRPNWLRLLARAQDGRQVIESMKDGVRIRPLSSPFSSDSIVVLRSSLTQEEISRALSRALRHENKPYDFDFDFRRSDRLVCTEVIYRAYAGIADIKLPLTLRAGRQTLSGSDLIRIGIEGKPFTPVCVYAPRLQPGIITGRTATEVLCRGEPD